MKHAKRRDPRKPIAVGAGVALLAVAVQVVRTSACASPSPRSGLAYSNASISPGDCSLTGHGPLFVSVSTSEYAGSAACGGFLDVTGPGGTVRVQVVDRCPGCGRDDLDMSKEAYARIAGPPGGRARIAYQRVRDPLLAHSLGFKVKTGPWSSWPAVLVVDHGNPLRAVRVKDGVHWRDLRRGSDNYWLLPGQADEGPFTLRVTDVYGHRATVSGVDLRPGLQRSGARLYRVAAPSPVLSPRPVNRSTRDAVQEDAFIGC